MTPYSYFSWRSHLHINWGPSWFSLGYRQIVIFNALSIIVSKHPYYPRSLILEDGRPFPHYFHALQAGRVSCSPSSQFGFPAMTTRVICRVPEHTYMIYVYLRVIIGHECVVKFSECSTNLLAFFFYYGPLKICSIILWTEEREWGIYLILLL